MIRIIFLLVGLALLAYLTLHIGLERIASTLRAIGWDFLLVLFIYTAYQALRAAALLITLPSRSRSSYRDMLWIRLSGEAVESLTISGPFLAEPAKAWLLKGRGLTTREAFAAILTEYLVYTFISAGMSVVGLTYLTRAFDLSEGLVITAWTIVYAMSAFLLTATIAIVFRIHLIGAIVQGLASAPVVRRFVRPNMDWVHSMEDLLLVVLRDRPVQLLGIVAIEALAHLLLIIELYLILRGLDLSVPIVYPLLIEAVTKFTSSVFFFIPTQVGAAEGTNAILFEAIGLTAAAGFTVAFVRRLRTMCVAGAGVLSLSWLTRRGEQA